MSISSITLTNFKGISSSVSIHLKPITLLFGANSAGKSTILQALQYAREIMERQNADPDRTILGGDAIDLGGFQNLVHRHESERRICIELEVTLGDDQLEGGDEQLNLLLEENRGKNSILPGDLDVNGLIPLQTAHIKLATEWSQTGHRAWVSEYTVGINGVDVATISADDPETLPGGKRPVISNINWAHPIFEAMVEMPGSIDDEVSEEQAANGSNRWGFKVPDAWLDAGNDPEDYMGGLRNDLGLYFREMAGQETLDTEMSSVIPNLDKPFPHKSEMTVLDIQKRRREQEDVDADDANAVILRSILGQCFIGVGKLVMSELKGMRYVGPIRAVPAREHHAPKHEQPERWANCLAAWDCIQKHYDHEKGGGDAFVRKLSHWMSAPDRLNLGYSLNVVGYRKLDDNSVAMLGIQQAVMEYDERDGDWFREVVWKTLMDQPKKFRTVLHDLRRDVDLTPQDVGVGVSQVVPVLVAAFEPNAKIVAIEQPELHVHPAVQVGLGDVLIEAVKDRNCLMLIETHSEHLLLRLLRRVRESTAQRKKASGAGEGDGRGYGIGSGAGAGNGDGSWDGTEEMLYRLEQDSLSVIYVSTEKDKNNFIQLPVDQDGEFSKRWPNGFFEERLDEML